MLLKVLLVASALFVTSHSIADDVSGGISPNNPPFALTLSQLSQWAPDSQWADKRNITKESLARREPALLSINPSGVVPHQDSAAKVLYAPDGMNNFGNYLTRQSQFNLYNFTHWADIDIFNWFAGTADHTVQIPARPWVDAAHRNGVKVIGSVFLGIARWGGSADTAEKLLEQDKQGRFVMADKLIDIAEFYGFDGWLINQETDLTAVKDAQNNLIEGKHDAERGRALATRMLAFVQYLTAHAPEGMEIHWYDSMVASGEVKWQNVLNETNSRFFQNDNIRTSDAIFLNYWWSAEMVDQSVEQAHKLGRSVYDIYTGADMWPQRTAQTAFRVYDWYHWLFDGSQAKSSLAVFAPNFNYNFAGDDERQPFSLFQKDSTDEARYYATEQRLFAGDDLNLATTDSNGWPGLASKLAASTTYLSLPFTTSFNTGHGRYWFDNGLKVSEAWSDMSEQSSLPTWQFAVFGVSPNHTFDVSYNFEDAFNGGSALRIEGTSQRVSVPLFATRFAISERSELSVTSKGSVAGLAVYMLDSEGKQWRFPLTGSAQWHPQIFSLSILEGKQILEMGLIATEANSEIDGLLGNITVTQ